MFRVLIKSKLKNRTMDEQLAVLYLTPKSWSHRYGDGIFTINILNVNIDATTSKAIYEIEISFGKNKFTITKRYSQFNTLHNILINEQCIDPEISALFPPKTWFSNVQEEFLNQRRCSLSIWLDTLLMSNKETSKQKDIRKFLEISALSV